MSRDTSNPFLIRGLKEGSKSAAYKRAPKQEKEGAKRLKGFGTPASGSKGVKGDVTVNNMARVEYKCTSAKSFSVTQEMLGKIKNAAIASNQVPFIEVEFLGAYGKPLTRVAIIEASELEIMLNRMRNAETEIARQTASRVAEERFGRQPEQHDDGRAPERRQTKLPNPRKQRDSDEGAVSVLPSVPRLVVPRGSPKGWGQANPRKKAPIRHR